MKKYFVLFMMILLMNSSFNITSGKTNDSIYLEGELLQPIRYEIMTLDTDGNYHMITDSILNDYEEKYVFITAEKKGELFCFLRKIENDTDLIEFKEDELIHEKITIGTEVNPLDGIVSMEFRGMPDEMKVEIGLKQDEEKRVTFSNNLEIKGVFLTDLKGNLGIPQGLVNSFNFKGDYVLKPKVQEVVMNAEPSFEDLFEIVISENNPVGAMFVMGQGGGCDYDIIDESGHSVYKHKFGDVSNPLHYESLVESRYKIKFSFNEGNLVLESDYLPFVKEENLENNIGKDTFGSPLKEGTDKVFYEVTLEELPFSQNNLDINELVMRSEPGILVHFNNDDQLEGLVLNIDELHILAESGKNLSVETNFGRVDFDSDCLREMAGYDEDFTLKFRYENAFSKLSEIDDFMLKTYGSQIKANMKAVASYELRIFLGAKDVVGTEFENRPEVTFFTKKTNFTSATLDKISAFVHNQATDELEMIESKLIGDEIKVNVDFPMPFYYFNLYEVNQTFDDISESWAKSYIESLASKGIISGVDVNNFNPKGKLTRAQFVTLLIRGLGIETSDQGTYFDDVNSSDWFASYVNTASKMSLLENHIGTSFSPNTEMMRKDMAEIVVKAYELMSGKRVSEVASKTFTDVPEGSTYIYKAVNLGLVSGISETKFEPNGALTREQAAYIIYSLIEMIG